MSKQQNLTEKELLEFWENFTGIESDDEGDFSDADSLESLVFGFEEGVFDYLFSNELVNKIVSETNLYAVHKKPERPVVFIAVDIRQYVGVILYMSLINMPNTRSYWNQKLEFFSIKSFMSVNAFEIISQFIHFNSIQQFIAPGQLIHDRLCKIRPLVDYLNKSFSLLFLGST